VVIVITHRYCVVFDDHSVALKCPHVTAHQQEVFCSPCGVGQPICSEGGLDIASNSGLEDNQVTDLCGTARLNRQLWYVLGKSGYMSKEWAATMDSWIQHRTEMCQRGDFYVPQVVVCDVEYYYYWHYCGTCP